ncbi:hypothetical protein NN561_013592 [Cricetulus griseus]
MPVPPGPGTPGSLRKEEGGEGRVYRAPVAEAARRSIAAAPGQLSSNFPPTTELAQALHCKLSLRGGCRLCNGLSLLSDFPGASGDGKGPWKYGRSPQFPGAVSPADLLASAQQLGRLLPLGQLSAVLRPVPLSLYRGDRAAAASQLGPRAEPGSAGPSRAAADSFFCSPIPQNL